MKTKEEILDEKKILRTAFSLIEIGENEDGSPYYLGTDDDRELDECVTIAESYASQQIEKYKELIKTYGKVCTYLVNYESLTPKGINSLEELSKKIEQLKNELGL